MTLEEFENGLGNYLKDDIKIALAIKRFYDISFIRPLSETDDYLEPLWKFMTEDLKCNTYSDFIIQVVEPLTDFEFYKKQIPYKLENMLYMVSRIAMNYQENDNSAIKDFMSLNYNRFRKFVCNNIFDKYSGMVTPISDENLGDILIKAHRNWNKSVYDNLNAKEAVTLILIYPLAIAFVSDYSKKGIHELLKIHSL